MFALARAHQREVVIALVAVIVIVVAAALYRRRPREGFVSKQAQEVYSKSRELFDKTGGGATYSEYKTAIPDAEAVMYTDTRNLWKTGQLTPEKVQSVL